MSDAQRGECALAHDLELVPSPQKRVGSDAELSVFGKGRRCHGSSVDDGRASAAQVNHPPATVYLLKFCVPAGDLWIWEDRVAPRRSADHHTLAPLVDLENKREPRWQRRLATLGGEGVQAELRLSRKNARLIDDIRAVAGAAMPPDQAAYLYGAEPSNTQMAGHF